jgi:hypothetical protein
MALRGAWHGAARSMAWRCAEHGMALRGAWYGAAHREGVLLSSPFRNERNGGEMPSGHLRVAWHRAT